MKKTFWVLAVILTFCGTSAQATDFTKQEPLKLKTPEMLPSLTCDGAIYDRPELELLLDDHAPWDRENWTWMRTNAGVKPYEVMDDLTFVGVPLFVAGIAIKGDKAMFAQNNKDGKRIHSC